MGASHVGELEQMILLAVLRLGGEAYALAIIRELDREAGRRIARGTLYTTLDRMSSKGLVEWSREDATPDRGGHPRRLFQVTPEGVELLRSSRETLFRLWDGLDGVLGERPA